MPQELYQELINRLHRLRARREQVALGTGISRTAAVIIVTALAAVIAEAIFHISILGRTILFSSVAMTDITAFILLLYPSLAERVGLKKKITNEALAAKIGQHFGSVEDRLVNVLQLASVAPGSGRTGGSFAAAAFAGTYGSVRHLDFNEIVDKRPLRRSLLLFCSIIAVTLGTLLIGGNEISSAANRLFHFRTFYQKPAPFTFIISPGNSSVLRGEAVKLDVHTTGEQLKSLTLHYREGSAGEFEAIELRPHQTDGNATTEFTYEIHPQHQTDYYLEAQSIESEHFTIGVMDRPVIKLLSVMLTPPAYTRLKTQRLSDNFGDIGALSGTRAEFSIVSSKPLVLADLIYHPQNRSAAGDSSMAAKSNRDSVVIYHLTTNGLSAYGILPLTRPGSYHILLRDTDKIESEHPIEYSVSLTEDEPPAIVLLEPSERSELPSSLRVPMLVKIHDDYGFTNLKLGYRLRSSKYLPERKEYKWIDLPLSEHNIQDLEVPYVWNLTPENPSPEDEFAYVLEVADNDNVTGPHHVRTSEFSVRFPSVDEIFKRADEASSDAEKSLREIKQDAEELKKKVDEAVNQMKQTPTSEIVKKQQDFSHNKDAEQMLKRQEELNNRVADVKKQLEQMTDQLNQQHALTPETMEKYMELQKLFDEIKTPELDAAMQKLHDAMKGVDPKAMEKAMKDFQFNEDQFKKSLERTANILNKIKAEQKVDQLMKRSDELAKDQDKRADEENAAAQHPDRQTPEQQSMQQRKQKDAENELDRMKQESKDLAKDMKKLPEQMQAPEEAKDAMEALNDPSLEKSMQDAEQSMQNRQHQQASQQSRDASQKAKNARNKLSQLKQKLAQNERQRTLAELKNFRDEMNRLSKSEEQLKKESMSAQPQSNVFRNYADDQSDRKEELGNAASDLFQLAQRSPSVTADMGKSLGEAFNNMQRALDAMSERNQNDAVQNTQGAMASLNQLSEQVQSAMNAMKQLPSNGSCPNPGTNPGDGSGDPMSGGGGSAMQQFLSQINQLAAQQQGINDKLQQMMNSGGGAQSAEQQMQQQQSQLARMAAEQGQVQKSLQDLANEQKEAQGANRKAAEDLKKLADEMQDAITQMRSKGIHPETIQRQERILSKLLQAERSVHERDKEQERESKSAEDVQRGSPPELDLNSDDAKRALRDDMLRSNGSVYSKDYQTLIKKYLEQLAK
ncbi:MAG TPA: DUF4175 family protein [Candidatus Kapabacteria bacterium]|nr:DUF4175 family protein [Candidatus Kapabacteria bacterium]